MEAGVWESSWRFLSFIENASCGAHALPEPLRVSIHWHVNVGRTPTALLDRFAAKERRSNHDGHQHTDGTKRDIHSDVFRVATRRERHAVDVPSKPDVNG